MTISTAIILDTRRIKKKNKNYPLKFRITINRRSRCYKVKYDLTEDAFRKLSSPRVSDFHQEIKEALQELKRTFSNFIKEREPSDFSEIEHRFITDNTLFVKRNFKQPAFNFAVDEFDYTPYLKRFKIFGEDHSRPGCISFVFLAYIKKLIQQGRIGSALNYQRSYMALVRFKGNVLFKEITVAYLYQFEQTRLSQGITKTTIAIILCPLRAVFNEAIEMGIILREKCYPFGRRRYQLPARRNFKKALGIDDVKNIFYYKSGYEEEMIAKDFWLFCYLANGMNVKDMVYLKYRNINDDYIVFERLKTERTTRHDPKMITAYIGPELKDIIERRRNPDNSPDNYLFPFMESGLTPLEEFDLVNHVRKIINVGMKKIKDSLGIEKSVTNIVSRHTFATVMKRFGASTEFIQESLGHTDSKTTENYLGSFENSVKKEFASALTAFKKTKNTKSLKFDEF